MATLAFPLIAATAGLLFGVDLESVVSRENMSGGVPGGVATSVALATQGASQVPLIIRRCVEEIERRGLDIIGEDSASLTYSVFIPDPFIFWVFILQCTWPIPVT